jgi:hypothetical protein
MRSRSNSARAAKTWKTSLPLVVLTAGRGHDAAWSAAQNRMATLSTNSVHRVIDGATHEDLVVSEEDAAATTQAILDVVASVRSPRRLAR